MPSNSVLLEIFLNMSVWCIDRSVIYKDVSLVQMFKTHNGFVENQSSKLMIFITYGKPLTGMDLMTPSTQCVNALIK